MRSLHFIGSLTWVLLLASGCATLDEYGGHYSGLEDSSALGIANASQLERELEQTHPARTVLLGTAERAQRFARCIYFHNQVWAAASQAEWELGNAAGQVRDAARDLEQAYQSSDDDFLRVCELQLQTPLGQNFINYWPENLRPPQPEP